MKDVKKATKNFENLFLNNQILNQNMMSTKIVITNFRKKIIKMAIYVIGEIP